MDETKPVVVLGVPLLVGRCELHHHPLVNIHVILLTCHQQRISVRGTRASEERGEKTGSHRK